MAAGVNFNNVWAALGKPVSVFRYHDEAHHIGGSDASGVVWKVGEGVTRWKPGDEVVLHCNQASYEDVEVHGLDPLAAPSQQIWGYETIVGLVRAVLQGPGAAVPAQARAPLLGGGGVLRPHVLHRVPDADRPGEDPGRRPRADLGRRRRAGRVRDPALQARRRRQRGRRVLGREGRAVPVARRVRLHRPQRVRGDDAARRRDAPRRRPRAPRSPAASPSTSGSCSAERPTSSSSTSGGRRSPRRC